VDCISLTWRTSEIRKVMNGVMRTVAGNGIQGSNGDNGPATGAELNQPNAVAVDSAGILYIAELAGLRIRKVSNEVTALNCENGPAISAGMGPSYGIAVDSAGFLYIADR
jgi:hypothetical protein